MKTNMNFGASARIFANAKTLRNKLTPAEEKIWEYLRKNKLGVRFRRQHPMAKYAVDFYCHKLKLVIEIDGEIHLDRTVQQEDQSKEESLLSFGLHIIRFTNDQVLNKTEEVITAIEEKIKELF